jgi:hypothetical protein
MYVRIYACISAATPIHTPTHTHRHTWHINTLIQKLFFILWWMHAVSGFLLLYFRRDSPLQAHTCCKCVCVYMYKCMHVCVYDGCMLFLDSSCCIFGGTGPCRRTRAANVCVCMYVCVYVTCVYVCMYVAVFSEGQFPLQAHTCCKCVSMYVCMYVCVYVNYLFFNLCAWGTCVYVCMCVCMYDVCIFVYVWRMYVCVCIHIHAHTPELFWLHTYAGSYTHIHTSLPYPQQSTSAHDCSMAWINRFTYACTYEYTHTCLVSVLQAVSEHVALSGMNKYIHIHMHVWI